MENIVFKLKEFGKYCLSICENKDKEFMIQGCLLNDNIAQNLLFVKLLRVQDDTEDKSVVELDENKNEFINHKLSQINEWINVFNLKKDDDVKNKLNEYLNYFISVKDSINL